MRPMTKQRVSYLDELTNDKERQLFQESNVLFIKLLNSLKTKGLLRTTIIQMDVDRLKKVWDNSRFFGLSFNRMVDKFSDSQVEEARKKPIEEQVALGYSFYSQLVGSALYNYEAVLKTTFVFVLDEYTETTKIDNKDKEIRIRKKMTLGQLVYNLKLLFPIEGEKLDVLLDINLRNAIAHGAFWFDNGKVFLAQNSHLDEVEELSLKEFWLRLRRINIISHTFIEVLLTTISEGYFRL
jgi:hypothetical protein